MTEIPEHLRKRAEEAKAKAAAKQASASESAATDSGSDAPAAAEGGGDAGRIPDALLQRSKAARERAAGGGEDEGEGGGGVATAERPASPAVTTGGAVPLATGPEGHTQRLLTVVKAGSIQDVKAKPVDKVHVWPHLLAVEFVASLAMTAFLLVFSILVNAPLQVGANYNFTPNPSKAPWYFLGLQELLTMFHPMVAGVTIPGMGILALMLAPYIDKRPSPPSGTSRRRQGPPVARSRRRPPSSVASARSCAPARWRRPDRCRPQWTPRRWR